MNSKTMLRTKVTHLEQALLETSNTMNLMEKRMVDLQDIINSYKNTGDKKDLIQNNDLIMDLIQHRLDVGKETYHQNVPIMPIDDISRDNFYEAVEEALDLSVYLSAFMLRLMKEKENQSVD